MSVFPYSPILAPGHSLPISLQGSDMQLSLGQASAIKIALSEVVSVLMTPVPDACIRPYLHVCAHVYMYGGVKMHVSM